MLALGPVRRLLNIFRDVLPGCGICILLTLAPFADVSAAFHKFVSVLNFYGSCGFVHDFQEVALQMIEDTCKANSCKVQTTNDREIFNNKHMQRLISLYLNDPKPLLPVNLFR